MAEKLVTQEELEQRVKLEVQIERLNSQLTMCITFLIAMSVVEILVLATIPLGGYGGVFRFALILLIVGIAYFAFQVGHSHACMMELDTELERLKGEEATPISTSP